MDEAEIPFPYPKKSSEERISIAYKLANRAIEDLQEEMRICENESEMDATLSAYKWLLNKLEVAKMTLEIKQTSRKAKC